MKQWTKAAQWINHTFTQSG